MVYLHVVILSNYFDVFVRILYTMKHTQQLTTARCNSER